MPENILFVISDIQSASRLYQHLITQGHSVTFYPDLVINSRFVAHKEIDVILIFISALSEECIDSCRALASNPATSRLPILVVSENGGTDDIVRGLNAGADDFIVMPKENAEIVWRIKAKARRVNKVHVSSEAILELANVRIDMGSRKLIVGKKTISLTEKELFLLRALINNSGKPLGRKELVQAIWGDSNRGQQRLSVLVSRLRHKIEVIHKGPRIIITAPRKGYRIAGIS